MRPIQWYRKVTGMPVVGIVEWDNPKDEERNKKRLKFGREVMMPYWEKLVKEKGIKAEGGAWSDNTGHMISWWEFETMEDFSKMWEDKRWQQMRGQWTYYADNVSIRLLRPSIDIPEDLLM